MDRILNYFKENATGVTILAFVAMAMLGITMASGCSLDDVVKVNVPPAVREVTNTKTKQVPLSRVTRVRERYIAEVTSNLEEFDANIEQASVFRDFAASLLNTGLTAGQGALAGVPGGGFLLAGLTGLGGLFLRKPGTGQLLKDAEDKGYDQGRNETVASINQLNNGTTPAQS